MSDLDTIKAMFALASIEHGHHTKNSGEGPVKEAQCRDHPEVTQSLEIPACVGAANHGYLGFVTYLFFDADGRLVCTGAWE